MILQHSYLCVGDFYNHVGIIQVIKHFVLKADNKSALGLKLIINIYPLNQLLSEINIYKNVAYPQCYKTVFISCKCVFDITIALKLICLNQIIKLNEMINKPNRC